MPEQLELNLNDPTVKVETLPKSNEVIGVAILGQGSETPELHVVYKKGLVVLPLTNPVTVKQIADILAPLN